MEDYGKAKNLVYSQYSHSTLTNALRPFKYPQTHVKWPKNTDACWAVLLRSYMLLELSKSFKIIQNHSKSGQFPPFNSRRVFD